MDRRVIWGAVAAGGVIVAIMLWSSDDAAAPPGQPTARVQQSNPRKAVEDQTAPDVNLDALRAGREEPADQGRNPFRFRPKAAPPAPVSVAPPPLFGTNQGPAGPTAPPLPSGPPPPPPIQLKLIGIVKQGDKMIAVLSDGGPTPASGQEGEIILGRYRLYKVGPESVEIAYEDGKGRTTLRLPPPGN